MLVDIHCHANLYLALQEVVKEAESNGVQKIIAVSMSTTSLERIMEISGRFEYIYPALGIHPEEVSLNVAIESQMESIQEYIRNNGDKICAIGEIGLDHHFIKNKECYPLQKMVFEKMLALAQELELPVNVHTKGAEKLVFEELPSFNVPNVNVHWYTGPENYLKTGIDRGYYFSITPAIRYSPPVKKVAQAVDIQHLLLESDGPVEYSGRIGTPAMCRDVLNTISRLKNVNPEDLERQIEENTKIIFPKIFSN